MFSLKSIFLLFIFIYSYHRADPNQFLLETNDSNPIFLLPTSTPIIFIMAPPSTEVHDIYYHLPGYQRSRDLIKAYLKSKFWDLVNTPEFLQALSIQPAAEFRVHALAKFSERDFPTVVTLWYVSRLMKSAPDMFHRSKMANAPVEINTTQFMQFVFYMKTDLHKLNPQISRAPVPRRAVRRRKL
ncbi:uncharacterized protein N7496_003084 [Penicillium cataractarum]|uniref:Uncharacterized protein n=1 Tax=Penicillium cataractarum TaxID=2100454 RepID=A0A9W9SLA7_9EURO|nr:uncharacterized protein N7496_003084 [Penicillium cataractarum]KAJ5380656.1 hypothetical protein N7496_003084 [Penicillium cataractarum]